MEQAFRLARSLHRSLSSVGNEIGHLLTDLSTHYGDELGLAHAAEVAEDQRDDFIEFIQSAKEIFGSIPAPPADDLRPAPAPRTEWSRAAYPPYLSIDEELDRALEARPGGDPGQGSSSAPAADSAMRTPSPVAEPGDDEQPPDADDAPSERSPSPELSKSDGKRRAE